MLVTDAVINPGSSGGALFSIRGKLLGIASGLISPAPVYTGHSVFVGPAQIREFLRDWEGVL
jgi:S1-C subfamily serine protease